MHQTQQQGKVCVVLGEQSLLTQCCELMLAREYQIALVATQNPLIVEWCEKNSIEHTTEYDSLIDILDGRAVDYLFSITNLRILAPEVLALPSLYAINFHDGPLPEYGGLNAPVWSLLNGETKHGVSWHVMTPEVDCGELLVQKHFSIADDETAFSLNTKCYQAAIETFTELLEHIDNSSLTFTSHELSKDSYHGLADKPDAAATISWDQTAQEISRLVRSLDFGRFANPVILPRLLLGATHLLVRSCEVEGIKSDSKPGTILQILEDSLSVATRDGTIKLTQLSDMRGNDAKVSAVLAQCGLKLGDRLPEYDDKQRSTLTRMVHDLAPSESFWKKQLLSSEPIEAPYVHSHSKSTSNWQHLDYPLTQNGLSSTLLISAFALLLGRLNSKESFAIALRTLSTARYDTYMQSYFSQVVPLNVQYEAEENFASWLEKLGQKIQNLENRIGYLTDLWARDTALKDVVDCAVYPIRFDRVATLPDDLTLPATEQTQLIVMIPDDTSTVRLHYDVAAINDDSVKRLIGQFDVLLESVTADSAKPLKYYPIVPQHELSLLESWNNTATEYNMEQCLHHLFESQASQLEDKVAYQYGKQQLTYEQLNVQANQLARYLLDNGAQSGDLIGIFLDRSLDMVVALLATLKAGCAYVPMDPAYPEGRLVHMVEDANVTLVVTQRRHAHREVCSNAALVLPEEIQPELRDIDSSNLNLNVAPASLAYVIYTSGSTGKPKGVMVEHRNVINFFVGMDDRLEPGPGTWLAVTSMSFDISVLEIFWTLSRGFTVVLYADAKGQTIVPPAANAKPAKAVDFGLFYWNVATEENEYDNDKYKLLLDSAQFADKHNFTAIWTPERHFSPFGGLFPNPSVTSAAIATITDQIAIRAGSCVVPLHSPIRIAEEWAVVDNLSNGRVGMAIAAGWAAPDFAIKPENFSEAKKIMFESAEIVKRLWRGETVEFPGPDGKPAPVRTLPRPLQEDLPLWITTAGNIDNFHSAGEMGANLLTHLLGQTIEEVGEKITAYREAWKKAGHAGQGTVTVMLHTFVGENEDEVEELVRQPLKNYLKSAMFLVKQSAWQFPTFKKMSEEQGKTLDEFFETISEEDMDALLEFAFARYFHTSGLFGTPESCKKMVDKIRTADVDEIACLIDFGIEDGVVLDNLPHLNALRESSNSSSTASTAASATVNLIDNSTENEQSDTLPELFSRHKITHFQCTPSMATLLVADQNAHAGLADLEHMMVGGEAFPPELSNSLSTLVGGRVTNMYGPTETTIWSSTGDVQTENQNFVSIGHPLANQQCYVLDAHQQRLPIGVIGELYIAGDGVVRGYHERPELTAHAFVKDPFLSDEHARMYRTGDLARYLPDGRLECLGRVDHQVKIRGYRVELGEIEAVLRQESQIREAAVIIREDVAGDKRVVAYLTYQTDNECDINELKQSLRAQLPEFMVPTVYVQMAQLPVTPNGKIDRNSLPKPQPVLVTNRSVSQLATGTQKMLVEIWSSALNLESVGVKDNFFDIGGHSLLIIQVLNELVEKVDKPVKLTDLFKYTTIETLAEFLDSETDSTNQLSQGQARVAARKASMARQRRKKVN